jgi:hypothetical protein
MTFFCSYQILSHVNYHSSLCVIFMWKQVACYFVISDPFVKDLYPTRLSLWDYLEVIGGGFHAFKI